MSKKKMFFSNGRLKPYNFVSLWSFEDDVLDSIGGNNGVYSGVNNYANGLINRCINFAHNTSVVKINNDISLSFNDGVNDIEGGVSSLIQFSSNTGTQLIINKRDNLGGGISLNKEWQISYNSTELRLMIFDQVNGGNIRVKYTWTPTIGQWYYIQAYYNGNGTHSGLTMYVDGLSVGSTSLTGTYVDNQNYSTKLVIGIDSWSESAVYVFNGKLDELKKSKIVLTPSEALYLATQELAGIKIIG